MVFRFYLFIFVFYFLFFSFPSNADQIAATEYEQKAAFVYNFTQFISWPPQVFSSTDSDFHICVFGNDPFGRTLDDIVSEEKVSDHPIRVLRIQDLEQLNSCHILFFPIDSSRSITENLPAFRERGILTIGDWPDFADQGGVIGFRMVERHVGLRINLEAARLSKLTISSKLLRLSEVIEEH